MYCGSVKRHHRGTPLPEGSARHDALPLGLQTLGPCREAMQAVAVRPCPIPPTLPHHISPCPAAAKEAYPHLLYPWPLFVPPRSGPTGERSRAFPTHKTPSSQPASSRAAWQPSQPASRTSPSTHKHYTVLRGYLCGVVADGASHHLAPHARHGCLLTSGRHSKPAPSLGNNAYYGEGPALLGLTRCWRVCWWYSTKHRRCGSNIG